MFGLALVTFFFNLSAPNRSYIKQEYTTQYIIVYLHVTLVFVGTGVLSTFTFKKNHRKILAGTIVVLVAAVWWFVLSILSFIPAIRVYKYVCIMDRCPPTQWIFELPWREASNQTNSSTLDDDEIPPTMELIIDNRVHDAGGNERLYMDTFWPENTPKDKQKTGNNTAPTEGDETSGNNKTLSENEELSETGEQSGNTAPTEGDETSGNNKTLSENEPSETGEQSDNERPRGHGSLQENQTTPMDGNNSVASSGNETSKDNGVLQENQTTPMDGYNSVASSGNETSKDNGVLQENQTTPMEGDNNDSTTDSSAFTIPLNATEPETEECPTRLIDAELFSHSQMEIVEPYLAGEYESDDNDDYDYGDDVDNNENTDDEHFDDGMDAEKFFTEATDVSDEATSGKTAAHIEEYPRGSRILRRTDNSLESSLKRQKWKNVQWHIVNFMSGVLKAYTENDQRAGYIAMSVVCFVVYSIFLAYGIWSMFYLYRETKRRRRRRLSRSRSTQGSIGSGRRSMASTNTPILSRSTTPTHSRTSNPTRHVSYDQNA